MSENIQHNHLTRDIKPKGQCPSCDKYHQKTMRTRWFKEAEEYLNSLRYEKCHGSGLKSIALPTTLTFDSCYVAGREKGHELAMVAIESWASVYHLLKTELAKHIDVEKFLDENVEM